MTNKKAQRRLKAKLKAEQAQQSSRVAGEELSNKRNINMSKKIVFDTNEAKAEAVAAEKAAHPSPTAYQSAHLADLEAAEVVG